MNNSKKAAANEVYLEWKHIDENLIQLYYKDNGKGISDEDLPNVFEYRFTTTNGGGLGLYHIKEIISKLKGTIEINNKVKSGVEFIITLRK